MSPKSFQGNFYPTQPYQANRAYIQTFLGSNYRGTQGVVFLFDLLSFFNAMLDTNKEKCKIFFQSSNVRGVCSTSLGDQRHWLCGIWYFLTARAPCYFQTWCMVKYVTFLNFPYLFCHSTAAYGQLESIRIDSLVVCMLTGWVGEEPQPVFHAPFA
jgi:hypothetical protein